MFRLARAAMWVGRIVAAVIPFLTGWGEIIAAVVIGALTLWGLFKLIKALCGDIGDTIAKWGQGLVEKFKAIIDSVKEMLGIGPKKDKVALENAGGQQVAGYSGRGGRLNQYVPQESWGSGFARSLGALLNRVLGNPPDPVANPIADRMARLVPPSLANYIHGKYGGLPTSSRSGSGPAYPLTGFNGQFFQSQRYMAPLPATIIQPPERTSMNVMGMNTGVGPSFVDVGVGAYGSPAYSIVTPSDNNTVPGITISLDNWVVNDPEMVGRKAGQAVTQALFQYRRDVRGDSLNPGTGQ
jgi:hypothetical protein